MSDKSLGSWRSVYELESAFLVEFQVREMFTPSGKPAEIVYESGPNLSTSF